MLKRTIHISFVPDEEVIRDNRNKQTYTHTNKQMYIPHDEINLFTIMHKI